MKNPNGPSIESKEEWTDELRDQEDKRAKLRDESPVEAIRRMNPGKFIPSGAELAALLNAKVKK